MKIERFEDVDGWKKGREMALGVDEGQGTGR